MTTPKVDGVRLAKYVKWKMDQEELSLRRAAAEAQVSPATLHRVLSRKKDASQLDTDVLLRLAGWAEVPLENLLDSKQSTRIKAAKQRSTPDVIDVHLRADKNLGPGAAEAISVMVRAAYEQFAKLEGKDK